MKADLATLPPNTLLILTDFAATMVLWAFQTKNSSVDGYAVHGNFVCMYNRRTVKVKDKDDEGEPSEEVQIHTVDVHHLFAETISQGKKPDHAMHNICLDAIITRYKSIFQDEFSITLDHVKLWTDNAPGQYRDVVKTFCR